MKTKKWFPILLLLLALLLSGCGTSPSKTAVNFVSQYPELRQSSVEHVLKSRVPDIALDAMMINKIPIADMEHTIVGYSFQKQWDEFRSMGFLFSPDRNEGFKYSSTSVEFYPYIGYNEKSHWAFIRAKYMAPSWLFFDQVMVLVGDERYTTPEMSIFSNNVQRDVGYGGSITERIDFPLTSTATKNLAYAIANADDSQEIKVRFVGDPYNHDFVLPMGVRRAWQDIIWYYDKVSTQTR